MIEAVPVNTFMLRYVCDECKKGEMVPTGEIIESAVPNIPPSVVHSCNACGARMTFRGMQYPRIDYAPMLFGQPTVEDIGGEK
jgi:DNA polymerase III alpha subunit (gram-positive type)